MPEKEVPKFGEKEMIQFIGLNDFTGEEQAVIQQLSTEHYQNIKRELHNVQGMHVHAKVQDKGGKRHYSFHVRLIVPTKTIEACNDSDWDLPRALHKAFNDVKQQVIHTFHTDVSHHKSYC
jgi:preprotein translocase subunit SecA